MPTTKDPQQRLADLELHVAEFRSAEHFRAQGETMEAIREGLASVERGEGTPVEEAFAQLRDTFKLSKPPEVGAHQ